MHIPKAKGDLDLWNRNRPGTRPIHPGGERAKTANIGRPAPGTVPKPGTPGEPRKINRPDGAFGGRINPNFDWNAYHAARPF